MAGHVLGNATGLWAPRILATVLFKKVLKQETDNVLLRAYLVEAQRTAGASHANYKVKST